MSGQAGAERALSVFGKSKLTPLMSGLGRGFQRGLCVQILTVSHSAVAETPSGVPRGQGIPQEQLQLCWDKVGSIPCWDVQSTGGSSQAKNPRERGHRALREAEPVSAESATFLLPAFRDHGATELQQQSQDGQNKNSFPHKLGRMLLVMLS